MPWVLLFMECKEAGFARALKVLEFKIKIQGLKSPWKLQSVLESPWNLLPILSNEASQVSETKIGALSTLSIDVALYWLDFAPLGVLEKWKNVSLKGLEKSLNFWSKKVYEPWIWYGESLWLRTSPNQTKSLEETLPKKPGFLAGWEGGLLDLN